MMKTMLKYNDLQEGQQLETMTKPAITKVQIVKYAGTSGDFNPLHTDDAFAQKVGMDGVIAHGMLVMGFLGQYVRELADTEADIEKFNMRFGDMTKPGDEITCTGIVAALYEQDGKKYADLDLKAEKAPEKVVGSGKAVLCFR